MRGASVTTILYILVITLIAIMAGLFFFGPASVFGFNVNKNIEPEKGKESVSSSPTQIIVEPFRAEFLKHLLSTKKPWDPFQPSEVACYLANTIYGDFRKYGKDLSERGVCWYLSKDKFASVGMNRFAPFDKCLISTPKIFTLEPFTVPQMHTYGKTWDDDLLNSKIGPCHLCEQLPGLTTGHGNTDKNNQQAIPPYLDEVCLNLQFTDRLCEAGGLDKFCDGVCQPRLEPYRTNQGFISFGNDVCTSPANNDREINGIINTAWQTGHCTGDGNQQYPYEGDFCDNGGGNLIYDWNNYWIMDCASSSCGGRSDTEYEVSEDDKFKENMVLTHDEKTQYIFGVTIGKESKNNAGSEIYSVLFARVPKQGKGNSFDFISDYFKNKQFYRWNRLGYWQPEARRIVDRVVTGVGDKKISDIEKMIADATETATPGYGLKTSLQSSDCKSLPDDSPTNGCVSYKHCSSKEDCTGTIPIRLRFPESAQDPKMMSEAPGKFINKSIIVESNIPKEKLNENLDPNKKYRVVINNWLGKFRAEGSITIPEGAYYSYYLRTVSVMQLEDKQCCEGSINLHFEEGSNAISGQTVHPIASGLKYCDHDLSSTKPTVYFYEDSANGCLDHSVGDANGLIGSCNINNEETTYCLTDEPWEANPNKGSCKLTNGFTVSGSGDKKYWACIDKDGKNDFKDAGESASTTITVTGTLELLWNRSDWQEVKNSVYTTFSSPPCDSANGWHPISCGVENYFPEGDNSDDAQDKYSRTSLGGIYISGDRCYSIAINRFYPTDILKQRVSVLCAKNLDYTVVENSNWNIGFGRPNTFESPTCPADKPWIISCTARANTGIQDYQYNVMIDKYIEDSKCKATFDDRSGLGGLPKYNVKVGAVCSKIKFDDIVWSDWVLQGNGGFWGNTCPFDAHYFFISWSAFGCPSNTFASGFTQTDSSQDNWYTDYLMSDNFLPKTTPPVWRSWSHEDSPGRFEAVTNREYCEQKRKIGTMCIPSGAKFYLGEGYGGSGIPKTCSDGTPNGSCSSTKPKYCQNGALINACGPPYICRCPPIESQCQADGSCTTPVTPGETWPDSHDLLTENANFINVKYGSIMLNALATENIDSTGIDVLWYDLTDVLNSLWPHSDKITKIQGAQSINSTLDYVSFTFVNVQPDTSVTLSSIDINQFINVNFSLRLTSTYFSTVFNGYLQFKDANGKQASISLGLVNKDVWNSYTISLTDSNWQVDSGFDRTKVTYVKVGDITQRFAGDYAWLDDFYFTK